MTYKTRQEVFRAALVALMHEHRPAQECNDEIAQINRVLDASNEYVAAWEESKLRPLRQQVAMLRNQIEQARNCLLDVGSGKGGWAWEEVADELANAICDTQATALAYEREVKANALKEAAEYFSRQDWRQYATGKFVEDELMGMAAELRANKE